MKQMITKIRNLLLEKLFGIKPRSTSTFLTQKPTFTTTYPDNQPHINDWFKQVNSRN